MRKRREQPEESSRPNIQELDNVGKWTYRSLRERYCQYAGEMGLEASMGSDLYPDVHSYPADRGWSCMLIDPLIERMKKGDLAAAEIGIEW